MKRIAVVAFAFVLFSTSAIFAGPEVHFFDSDGVKIRYTTQGEGDPVLLIHGFGLSGTIQWRKIAPRLAEKYKVITIDNRGHGGSEKPHDVAMYGTEMIEDQVRLLDHLGIEKAHVMGYSMGGGITIGFLAEHPERIQSAVIGGMGWRSQGEDGGEERLLALADALDRGEGFGLLFEFLASTEATEEQRKASRSMGGLLAAINDQKAMAAVLRGNLTTPPITEAQIKAIDVPMIAIIGSLDPIIESVNAMKAVRPDMPVIEIDDATHSTAYGSSEFIEGALGFIEAHPMAGVTHDPTSGVSH